MELTSKVDLDKIKNEFHEVDFHPLEAKPKEKYTYSVYYKHLKHTLNTYLRKPIKKSFTSNSKKLVITVTKANDKTIDSVYPKYRTEADWRENTEAILSQAVDKMFSGNANKPVKPVICRNNKHELNKHELVPYYKTRDFRKKIA